MAATEKLPSTNPVPITTDSIVLPFETGPIDKIMESVSTQSVAIDTTNLAIQEVLPSNEIELGVTAPSKKMVDNAVGQLLGGKGFLYELRERRELKGYFDLWITSFISPLQPVLLAKALQAVDRRLSFYVEGNLVAAL